MQPVTEMAVACPIASVFPRNASFSEDATVSLPWFALQIRQTGRAFCEEMLTYVGLDFFSPCTTEERVWSDRRKVFEVPLFPGYIFCRFDPTKRLPVLQTPGVIGVVSAGKQMLEIDASEIEAIRRALRSKLPLEALPYLAVGERVTIQSGPMAGQQGIVERHKGKTRLVLAVSMLNRSVCVEVDANQLQ